MTAEALLNLGRAWLGAGAVTAVAFVPFGAGRVEPGARGAWVFRVLLIPGVVLLWPLVLVRWARLERGAARDLPERPPFRAQERLGLALSLAIPLILAIGLAIRQDGPVERPALLIDPPAEAVE
mgnify:CR=1 FL=1